jgi:hypothetical protein
LHIGVKKTGTTFLQNWIALNSDLLGKSGVQTLDQTVSHHLGIEFASEMTKQKWLRDELPQLQLGKALAATTSCIEKSPHELFLISSESFRIAEPHLVSSYFSSIGVRIAKIIIFVRRQDLAITSAINQRVKSSEMAVTDWRQWCNEDFDWNRLYSRWLKELPSAEIAVRSYDRCVADDSLLQVFKEEIGYDEHQDDEVLPSRDLSNPSLCASLLEVCRIANERKHYHLRDFLLKAQLDGFVGQKYGLSQEAVTSIEHFYRESNERLAFAVNSQELLEITAPEWRASGTEATGSASIEILIDLLARAVSTQDTRSDEVAIRSDPEPNRLGRIIRLIKRVINGR